MELQIAIPASQLNTIDYERELVERAKHDREAFSVLYRNHYQAIAGYVYRRVGDSHTTEDLAAEVFMTALQSLPRYRHRGLPVRAWFYRIATHHISRWARRQRKRAVKRLDEEAVEDKSSSAQACLTNDYVRTALLTLAPKFQTVLALHYLEGMPIAQVAKATGCREGTVKSRLSRGRDALRQRLQQRRSQS